MTYPILARKLKNRIRAKCSATDLRFELKNIIINGSKRGCSGFISNETSDITVYVNTEPSVYLGEIMWRYARDNQDYRGGINQWAISGDDLVEQVSQALQKPRMHP